MRSALALFAVLVACKDKPTPPSPPAHVETSIAPCALDAPPAGARIASRDPDAWIWGEASSDGVRAMNKVGARFPTSGASSVGRAGFALTFALEPSAPAPAVAIRADAAGTYHLRLATCPTPRPSPELRIDVVHGDTVAQQWAGTPVRDKLAKDVAVELAAGDVLRLSAVAAAAPGEVAFDLAVWR